MSTPSGNISLPFGKSHAFFIGIDAYEHVSPLSTAAADAQALADQLQQEHGYEPFPPLLNANRAEMLKLLKEEIPALVGKDDRVLFYFAGHGIALDSVNEDPNGYLVPADAKPGEVDSLIPMDLLHDVIMDLPCKHGMIILDCCFAGAFKWSTGFRDVVFDLPSIMYEERFYQYASDPAWQVITSSASDQKAADILSDRTLGFRDEEGRKHSPFAQALMDALDGDADTIPRGRGDGVVTATELYVYLRDRVEDETTEHATRQSPSIFSLKRHEKGQYIFLPPRHRLNLPPIPRRNPFMGLKSYDEADANLFYGRDRVIQSLLQLAQANPLVVVSSASGTGKSSAIKAGLLPRLREENWRILPVIRPGKSPMKVLETELPNLNEWLQTESPGILVIDQYEELVTQCQDPEERIAFESKLAEWIVQYPGFHTVISIRSDFEPQFEQASLAKWWYQAHYAIPAFTQNELREVIIKPTIQEVLFFEPESLIDRLVDAVNQAPGALPLLSFTLSELYHAYINSGRTNRAFTQEDYEALGGVIGALRTRADTIYHELDEANRKSMFWLMMRMVSLQTGELVGKRVYNKELIYEAAPETARQQAISKQLIKARLLLRGRDAEGRVYIEPAHDALVRGWARLWKWIKELGEEMFIVRRQLWDAVQQYEKQGRGQIEAGDMLLRPSLLWDKNPKLDQLKASWDQDEFAFNAAEARFIRESWALRQNIMERLRTERDQAISMALSVKALQLADRDSTQGIRLAEIAYEYSSPPTIESEEALMRIFDSYVMKPMYRLILKGHTSFVNAVAISPDQQWLATGSADNTVRIWDLETGTEQGLIIHAGAVEAVLFLPEGNRICTGSLDQTIRICEVDGTEIKVLEGHQGGVLALACSPDGRYLASGSTDKTVGIWEWESGTHRFISGHFADVLTVSFAPDGQSILSGSRDTTARLWNLDGTERFRLTDHQEAVLTTSISPDGKYLLTGSGDHTLRLWSAEGDWIRTFEVPEGIVNAASFSPDGKQLMAACSAGTTFQWAVSGDLLQRAWRHHQAPITDLAISSDGSCLVTGSEDLSTRVWETNLPKPLMLRHREVVWAVAYGHRAVGKKGSHRLPFLVSGTDAGIGRIWDSSGKEIGQLSGHTGAIYATDTDPTGPFVLTGSDDATARLWNLKGEELAYLAGHEKGVISVAFSPDGQLLLTASRDQTVRLWNRAGEEIHCIPARDGRLRFATFCRAGKGILIGGNFLRIWEIESADFVAEYECGTPMRAGAVSRDGQFWITGNENATATLWNAEGEVLQTFVGHQKAIHTVAFSPDNRYVITGSADKTIRIWDGFGRMIQSFEDHTSYVRNLAFSEDGRYLYSAGDTTLRQWWMPKRIREWLQTAPVYRLSSREKWSFGIKE